MVFHKGTPIADAMRDNVKRVGLRIPRSITLTVFGSTPARLANARCDHPSDSRWDFRHPITPRTISWAVLSDTPSFLHEILKNGWGL